MSSITSKGRMLLTVMTVVLVSGAASAQSILLYDSGGFEFPTFNGSGATLAGYNAPPGTPGGQGTGSQNGWSTSDLNQFIGFPAAGLVQNTIVQSGSQAFHVIGERLFDDPSLGGGTLYWRYPDTPQFPGNVFNPVASGTPIVVAQTGLYRNDAVLTTDIPLKGMYFEGLRSGGLQRMITQVAVDPTGTIQVTSLNAFPNSTLSSAPGLVANQTWVDIRVQMDFSSQSFRVFLNNTLIGFGPGQALTNVPFRDSDIANGPFDRLREYGYAAYFNSFAGITTGDVYFDNFSLNAISIPEPASLALIGLCITCGGMLYYRRQVSKNKQADLDIEVSR